MASFADVLAAFLSGAGADSGSNASNGGNGGSGQQQSAYRESLNNAGVQSQPQQQSQPAAQNASQQQGNVTTEEQKPEKDNKKDDNEKDKDRHTIMNASQPMNIQLPGLGTNGEIEGNAQEILQNPGLAYNSDFYYPMVTGDYVNPTSDIRAYSAGLDAAGDKDAAIAAQQASRNARERGTALYNPEIYGIQEYGYANPGENIWFNADDYNDTSRPAASSGDRNGKGSQQEGVTAEDEKAQAVQDLLNRYNGWNKLTQREQFNRTMFNDDGSLTDFGQAIVDDFGEDFGNRDNAYEEWRDSDNRDLTSRLYGYDGNQGIQGWQALAKRSGVNDLDGMMDYMWGDENAFNPLEWLQDESYAANGKLGYSDDAAAALAQYMYNNGLTLPEGVQGLNGVNLSEAGNAEDFGTYALLNQMFAEGAQNNNQIDLNRYDLDRLNDILGASGEGYMLGTIEDNGEFREKENTNPRNYSMAGLLQGQVNPYVGEGNSGNLDADELDTMLALLNASYEGQGKKIGIKER